MSVTGRSGHLWAAAEPIAAASAAATDSGRSEIPNQVPDPNLKEINLVSPFRARADERHRTNRSSRRRSRTNRACGLHCHERADHRMRRSETDHIDDGPAL
jgi:hypothetical protein